MNPERKDQLMLLRWVDPPGVTNSGIAKAVLRAIDDIDGGDGCWASVETLAAVTGFSRRSVSTAVRELAKAELIEGKIGGGRGQTNFWRINWDKVNSAQRARINGDKQRTWCAGAMHSVRGLTPKPRTTGTKPRTTCAQKRNETQQEETQVETSEKTNPINDPDMIQKSLDRVRSDWKDHARQKANVPFWLKHLSILLATRQQVSPDDWWLPASRACEYAKSPAGGGKFGVSLKRFLREEMWTDDPSNWQDSGDKKPNRPKTASERLAEIQRAT